MSKVIFVGLDVHKESTTICFYDQIENEVIFTGKIETSVGAIVKSIERCRKKLEYDSIDFVTGYEAGCLGYFLAKELNDKNYICLVLAPNSIYDVLKNRRVKNDERDAETIARALAYGQYSSIEIPNDMDLDLREIIHMRSFYVDSLTRFKNSASSMIMRYGHKYSGKLWTKKHLEWLKKLELSSYARLSLDSLISQIEEFTEQVAYFDSVIEMASKEGRHADKVKRLRCFYGINTLTAMTVITEIGDFTRFPNAKTFVSFLGLMPGEKSSGAHHQNTNITKAGNKTIRSLLVESAQSFMNNQPEFKTKRMRDKQQGADKETIKYADRCNKRLFHKVKVQKAKGKNSNKIKIAIAHELACFIWGMMTGNTD